MREWGDPAGRPVLFLHGLGPVNSSAFLGLSVRPLVDAGFRVIGVDLPGFGASPPRDGDAYDLTRLGGLVWAVADACDVERPVVIGHRWGASIACHAAAARPESLAALVLADAGHRDPNEPLDASLEEIVRGAEGARLHAADRAAVTDQFEVPVTDPLVDVVLAVLVDDGSGGLVSAATAKDLATARYHAMRAQPSRTWPSIAAAGIPTLALLATVPDEARVANEADSVAFVAAVAQADVILVENASHQMIADLRADFGALVVDWLAGSVA